jgi:hypothetical protein
MKTIQITDIGKEVGYSGVTPVLLGNTRKRRIDIDRTEG